ncbi:kinase-like domain-containing protein [Suillus subaureus]|uniref:Kinase-like domain-containing protein n=1 Tax=Suillus subaureus TaxID=48587 RepID=A0A9P7EE60_9AGAM|nr:kinase-like domain-containing protein [Suillus subaureus]KAG1818661.1 kinase-like domain-containing protein [Suillus subaureus]
MLSTTVNQVRGEEQRSFNDLTQHLRKRSNYPIAHGGFGDIWRCSLVLSTQFTEEDVAVKAIRSYFFDENDRIKKDKRLRRELIIWQKLIHDNILPLYGVALGFGPFTAMVSPWAKNGSLTSYLESRRDILILDRFKLLSDIASGLRYLHSNEVVHGDLSGSNILVMENGTACLSDFGLSGVVSEFFGSSTFSSTISGNIRWGAPELFALPENQDGSTNRPTKEADIYSFGSIMLQVLSGKVPYYYIKQQMQIIMMVVDGRKPRRPEEPKIAEEHWSMIERCWSSCNVRPTIEDILNFVVTQLKRL